MKKKKILIIGAGLSGLSAAYFLTKKRIEVSLFEKNKECGGLCRSVKKDGFIFDFSGHLLHFRDRKVKSFVKDILGDNLLRHKRNAQVYTFGRFIPYPFQLSLDYLPKKVFRECLEGVNLASNNGHIASDAKHFLGWINAKFGAGIARHFMIPYNEKFWNMPLTELNYDWARRFIIRPHEKYFTSKTSSTFAKGLGYNASFWYPKQGGIQELPNALAARLKNIHLKHELYKIYPKKKVVEFKNGIRKKYDILISTLPLPMLGKIINDLPGDIVNSIQKLRWLSIYNVNLGIEGKVDSSSHWIYFAQKDISFFRVGFFNNFASFVAPFGKSSLYAEVSYMQNAATFKKDISRRIKADLGKIGLLKHGTRVISENINDIKYGYPVYDKNYRASRKSILKFLRNNDIVSCGRFGGWRYLSMEDVIIEGRNIANIISDEI